MQKENIKIISTIVSAVVVAATVSIIAAVEGAIGMSYALYGAAIGGAIGAVIAKVVDPSLEGTFLGGLIGAEIGAICGVLVEKFYKSNHEESGIDNSDYGKGFGCTAKAVATNMSSIVGCTNRDLYDCIDSLNGFKQISDCMGDHYDGSSISA